MEMFCVHVVGKVSWKSSALQPKRWKYWSCYSRQKIYLKENSDWQFCLDHAHIILPPILFVVMLTISSDEEQGFHVEHIVKDADFCDVCICKAQHFFRICTFPELLGKWYTSSKKIFAVSFDIPSTSSSSSNPNNQSIYCTDPFIVIAKDTDKSEMIACENPNCSIEWFHTECLKIWEVPNGKWYCPDSRNLPKFNKRKKVK